MSALPDNAQTWVDALKSGEYYQDFGQLVSWSGYCCLGVACDISKQGAWEGNHYVTDSTRENTVLPKEVITWLGLRNKRGALKESVTFDTDEGAVTVHELIEVNDALLYDFDRIADFIEENWDNLKRDEDKGNE